MKQLQQEMLSEAQQRMQTPEGANDLRAEEIEEVAGVIVASVIGGAWATMDEWGTGSLMDTSNPALNDYKNSSMWNPARHDTKIRSRPDAPGQINIFGNPVNGRGKGGVDLEVTGVVKPSPPSHALQTAARWMANGRMRSKIQEIIQSFPYSRFIVCDKK